MSGLQERITEAIETHVWNENRGQCNCGFGEEWAYDSDAWSAHVAAALIEALGLTEERTALNEYAARNGEPLRESVRWVTAAWDEP